jgi:uncharacterized protein YndB with AHSA1/START domain
MRPGEIQRTEARVQPRVGGEYQIIMHAPSGPIMHTGIYSVIDRPRKLVFTWCSPHAGEDSLVTVDFIAQGKRTEVVVTHEKLPQDERSSHANGWTSGLAHLDTFASAGQP